VTVIDANLLLYAYNADAPQQPAAAQWLTDLFESGETVALPWISIWAFLRISTSARIWGNPLAAQQAFAIVGDWLDLPNVVALQPGPRHLELLQRLVVQNQAAGRLMTDAVLAALAMENGALLASTDQDFGRFAGLRWVNPLNK
jgi:uncharacterized protein